MRFLFGRGVLNLFKAYFEKTIPLFGSNFCFGRRIISKVKKFFSKHTLWRENCDGVDADISSSEIAMEVFETNLHRIIWKATTMKLSTRRIR